MASGRSKSLIMPTRLPFSLIRRSFPQSRMYRTAVDGDSHPTRQMLPERVLDKHFVAAAQAIGHQLEQRDSARTTCLAGLTLEGPLLRESLGAARRTCQGTEAKGYCKAAETLCSTSGHSVRPARDG